MLRCAVLCLFDVVLLTTGATARFWVRFRAGWVENTAAGTVRGEVCGSPTNVERFKSWLELEGAPKAKPERAEFGAEKEVDTAESEALFPKGFEVRKTLLPNGKQWA